MHTHARAHDVLRPFSYSPPTIHAVASVAPWLHATMRIGAGLLFLEHGLQKLFGLLGGAGPQGGSVPLNSLFGFAGVLELVGGSLLVLGFMTRPVAFVLTIEMISAFFIAHAPHGGMPVQNHGELPLLYALVFLNLVGFGAGPFSVDNAMSPRARSEGMGFER